MIKMSQRVKSVWNIIIKDLKDGAEIIIFVALGIAVIDQITKLF